MIIVIDTNALLQIFSPRSKTPEIVDALINGQLSWAVSNEVLSEYEEMVCERSGAARWQQVERVIQLLHLRHQKSSGPNLPIATRSSARMRMTTSSPTEPSRRMRTT